VPTLNIGINTGQPRRVAPTVWDIIGFFNSRESGNQFFFLNHIIEKVFTFFIKVFNQLNLTHQGPNFLKSFAKSVLWLIFEAEENWIPAFAGMTYYQA